MACKHSCGLLVFVRLAGQPTTRERPVLGEAASVVVAIYIALILPLAQQGVLATLLQYALLPTLVLAVWNVGASDTPTNRFTWLALGAVIGALLMLTHTSSVAFVTAAVGALGLTRSRVRFVPGAVLWGVPVVTWFVVRQFLQQSGSHVLGFGVGRETAVAYLIQTIRSVGALVVPDRYGLPFVAFGALVIAITAAARRQDRGSPTWFLLSFALASLAFTYGLFNLTWVSDPISSRFVLFAPLVLVPTLVLSPISKRWTTVAVPVVMVTLVPLVYWVAVWSRIGRDSTPEQLGFPGGFALHDARLSTRYIAGPPVKIDGGWLISPGIWEEPAGRRR